MPGWSLRFMPSARRDLKRLDRPVQRRILDGLDRFITAPRSGDIRKLDSVQWRLRIGDWRVRFSFDDGNQVIIVLRILPRGRAYDR
ncbi:MAG: type II toxin-antitoxin system RelE/ParE family toxin [Actinobacteria bacterium]|nr:type II toxin-antitoxin system RelE/ParE family toxin [Actinomycetota bacterium]